MRLELHAIMSATKVRVIGMSKTMGAITYLCLGLLPEKAADKVKVK